MAQENVGASKWLSFVLRHDPASAGLAMDAQGWVEIPALLAATPLIPDREALEAIVRDSGKQRFAISEDGGFIRANQGHSVAVDLGLVPLSPPEVLYHGTSEASLAAILAEGLRPMERQHVHLSLDAETARQVGGRHGRPVVLAVAAGVLHRGGQPFYLSENRVWLTGPVPPSGLSRT
ncbi:RNA 2'-phosphotransferase [Stagnihabitans tardus]|uniref:Probable RNA 2'-phosphotransferase n=1 Tax=Stagnihabitans tardus TaxID=2699202 RepID=A0AAE5BRS7_9RHOB|nr:RNA 2'-phosphotransferase [Stagnihabitans tardus]NBZ86930.1 RNA--NAD 2'-phosphotransferase [Stagnihabitans tardus]